MGENMNKDEVAGVLVVFATGWPRQQIPKPTAILWADALARFDGANALEAARLVVEEERQFPTPSVFIAALQRVNRRHAVDGTKGLPAPARTPEHDARAKARIAELRKLLQPAEVDA